MTMKRPLITTALLLILPLASSLFAEQTPRFLVASSEVMTDPTPGAAPGHRGSPRAVAIDDGYCVAWSDTRQGGGIVAARVGTEGTVLDPLGVPISASGSVPHAVLRTWEGCTIVADDFFKLDHDGTVRDLDMEPVDGRFITSDGVRALFMHGSGPSVTSFTMIDGHGMTLARGAIEGTSTYEPLIWADMRDENLFIARSSYDSDSGLVELWSGSVDLQLEQIGSFDLEHFHDVRIATDGEHALLVTAELPAAGDSWSGWGNMTARLISSSGEVLNELDLDDLYGTGGRPRSVWYDDGAYKILRYTDSGSFLVTTNGYEITETKSVPPWFEQETVTVDDGRRLTVTTTNQQELVYTLEDVITEPRRLTSAPPHEFLVDADLSEDQLAMLWYEKETNASAPANLFVSVGAREDTGPAATHLVAEIPPHAQKQAAVAVGGGEAFVVWADVSSISYRRLNLADGAWRDPEPVEMRGVDDGQLIGFNPAGLTYGPDGFVVTWVEWLDTMMVARVSDDGHTIRPAEVSRIQREPRETAVLDLGDHYLFGWTEDFAICEFLCPAEPYPVGLAILDRSFALVEQIATEAESGILLARGDGLALVLLGGEAILIETSISGFGDSIELEIAPQDRFIPTSAMWTGKDFLVAGYYFDQTRRGSSLIRVSPDGSAEIIGSSPVVVQDHANGVDLYAPFAFQRNRDLVILGSEVSLLPEEGFVRRLRETIVRPANTRARAVRRPR